MRVWRLTSDICLSVAYIWPKSKTERPRKTKIGTEVGHVSRDSDTTFKVKRSKVNLQGAEAYCGGLPHSLFLFKLDRRRTWGGILPVLLVCSSLAKRPLPVTHKQPFYQRKKMSALKKICCNNKRWRITMMIIHHQCRSVHSSCVAKVAWVKFKEQ